LACPIVIIFAACDIAIIVIFTAAGRAGVLRYGVYRHGFYFLAFVNMAKCQGKKIIALSKHKPAYIDRVILELSVT
jgi:hypothetical protein